MKWTIGVSSDLDEVLTFLANDREVYALKSLENGSYCFSRSKTWQPEQHTLGDFRHIFHKQM